MKKINLIVLILFAVGLMNAIAQAQPPKAIASPEPKEGASPVKESSGFREGPLTMEEGLAKKISLDLRGMDIVDTIKFLSMKGNLNIVTSKNVAGRITLFLKNVTVGDTLEVILLTNKLACETKKNIITIMTEAEYEALYGKKYIDKRKIKTIKLKYVLPSTVGQALGSLKSTIGKIIMDDATGTLIFIDTPEKIEQMEKTALGLDEGLLKKAPRTISKVFELEYAKVEDLEPKITEVLTADLGSVRTDERTNKIIVRDLPYKIEEFEELISAFDSKTRQVIIEAKVVEVTLNDDFAFGISWEKIFTSSTNNMQLLGSFPFISPSGTTGNYGKISIGTWRPGFYTEEYKATGVTGAQIVTKETETWHEGGLDPRQTQQVLTFLKSIGEVRVISSPHIAVCNNEEAQIMVGTRQPYATSTISQSETTATTSWNAEFVDLGVTLTVTPTINKSGFVRMHIKPEVSTLTGWFEIADEAGVAQIKLPEVDTSNAETNVLIQDGRTIIIAGLIKNKEYKEERKFPVLGDIPVLGNLFRSKSTGTETKELVIFLTPRIISGKDDVLYLENGEKARKPAKK